MKNAVILLSGGLDSTTCLAMAQDQGYTCYTVSFDYGQRHRSELIAAKNIAAAFHVKRHEVVQLSIGNFGGSALTDITQSVPDYMPGDTIPVTYVPARNTVFLAIALGFAEVVNASAIFIGASSVDYSAYPDCRPEYMVAFQQLANLATKAGVEGHPIKIEAPLMHLSKADTLRVGLRLGVDYAMTVSCYQATEEGLACGRCDSCGLRKKGFVEANVADPTRYVSV